MICQDMTIYIGAELKFHHTLARGNKWYFPLANTKTDASKNEYSETLT